jgi:hypothetical protein
MREKPLRHSPAKLFVIPCPSAIRTCPEVTEFDVDSHCKPPTARQDSPALAVTVQVGGQPLVILGAVRMVVVDKGRG